MTSYPKVSIWSQFRNAAGGQIDLYRRQIDRLDYPSEALKLYLCEGDSKDNTLLELQKWGVDDGRVTIVQHNTNIPHYAHSPRPERMKAVSENGNVGWDRIANDGWGAYALMLESDLLYKADLLKNLIARRPAEADIFAPMVWIQVQDGIRFYDVWAYRKDGVMFEPTPPEWYAARCSGPFELDSVGSVVLFKMQLIHEGLRLGEFDCVLGMCNEARKRGYKVFCDPEINVLHPQIEGVS